MFHAFSDTLNAPSFTERPAVSGAPEPRRTGRLARVPAERAGSALLGTAVHLGPAVVWVGLLSWLGASAGVALASFAILSALNLVLVLEIERRAPAVERPAATREQLIEGLTLVFVKGALIGGAVVAAGWWLGAQISPWSGLTGGWGPIFSAVLLTDAAYYWVHRALNHGRGRRPLVRWFRRNHVTHHTVPELDFLRGNVSSLMDTAVTGFQVPLAILATLTGLDLTSTMIAYGLVLMLQATHHVNHTFHLGALRYLFMDNHAHKFHHCPGGSSVNHGAMFSIWDRAHGTFFEDFGLSPDYMHKHRIMVPAPRRGR